MISGGGGARNLFRRTVAWGTRLPISGWVQAPSRPSLPLIVHLRPCFNLLPFQNLLGRRFLDAESHRLAAGFGGAGVADDVVAEDQIFGFSPHSDTSGIALEAVVLNHIFFETIAVTRHPFCFIAEVHSVLFVRSNLILLQKIVGILVPDGNAETAIILQDVLLKQPVPDPPAEEQAVLPVAAGDTLADHGPLRTAAPMQAQPCVVLADTALHEHIVRLLKADAVAAGIAHYAVLDHRGAVAI